jgi:hypothetical protein
MRERTSLQYLLSPSFRELLPRILMGTPPVSVNMRLTRGMVPSFSQ